MTTPIQVERRRHPRIMRLFPVRYGIALPIHIGASVNISPGGLLVRGSAIINPGSPILVQIDKEAVPLSLKRSMLLKGDVRWRGNVEPVYAGGNRFLLGVRVPGDNEELMLLCMVLRQELAAHADAQATPELSVFFDSLFEFSIEYENSIGQGGLFVPGSGEVPVNREVIVSLNIAGQPPILLRGRTLTSRPDGNDVLLSGYLDPGGEALVRKLLQGEE